MIGNWSAKTRINSSNQGIQVSYDILHSFIIIFYFTLINFRCVFSFSNAMHVRASTMLSLKAESPILKVPLRDQYLFKKQLKVPFKKPSGNVSIIDQVLA